MAGSGGHAPTAEAEALPGACCCPGPRFTFVEDGERLPAAGVQAAGGEGKPGRDGEAGDGQPGGDVAGSEELLVQQLVNGGAGGGVCLEHLLDEGGGHGVDVLGQRAGEPSDPGRSADRHMPHSLDYAPVGD